MSAAPSEGGDDALAALCELDAAMACSISELSRSRERIADLRQQRAHGKSWRELVTTADRPLVVESLTTVLERLNAVGGRFRRAEAHALHSDGLSMERIASLFGVTRQRVSALLRDRG